MSRELVLILGLRVWQGLAGLVTIIFVARYLSPAEQGWYYTFVSVAALYSVFEMGLSSALVQTSGHLFQGLRWLPTKSLAGGKVSVFCSFLAHAFRAYLHLAGIFVLLVFTAGVFYFSVEPDLEVAGAWHLPWLGLVLATGGAMLALPFLSIVEGTGAMAEAYGVRLLQGVVGAVCCWILLANGATLWASAAAPAAATLVALVWLMRFRWEALAVAMTPQHEPFDWRREVLPLQWRVGVSSIGAYFMSQLATPILFYFQNPVVAGQMGLSLTVAHMLGLVAQSSMARVVPAMSVAVASGAWDDLSLLFRRGLAGMVLLFALGAGAGVFVYGILGTSPYVTRLLAPAQMIELLCFVFFYQINGALATQLRAFRHDPLVLVYATGAALTVGGSLILAPHESSAGVVRVMLVVQAGIVFPTALWIWRRSLRSRIGSRLSDE